jgi:S1-C subfamily serine protease
MTSVIGVVPESVMEFNEGERKFETLWEGTSFMKYMASVLLLVAATLVGNGQTSHVQQEAGQQLAPPPLPAGYSDPQLCAVLPGTQHGKGVALLHSGVSIRYERRQVIGSTTRLYYFDEFCVDIPTDQIERLQSEANATDSPNIGHNPAAKASASAKGPWDNYAPGAVPKRAAVAPAGTRLPPHKKDIAGIAKEANGSIVSIIMSDQDGHPIAQGSGFLISKDGHIVTNYHVIKTGSSAFVKLPNGALFAVDGVLASNKDRDLAIIKAHGNDFRTLTLGDSDQLQVGEEVVAIGNPLSLESTVSNGIVSAIRTIEDEGGKFVQITAPISPGSSGGPLFNMAGEVVGITTSHIKGGENLNFAIPINDVKPMLQVQVYAGSPPLPAGYFRPGEAARALPDEPEAVTAEQPTGPSLGIQAQDLTFDGSKNKRLQFHRGNLHIEAECDGGFYCEDCPGGKKPYSGCLLPGLPGDSTSPRGPDEAGEDGIYHSMDTSQLCFFKFRNGKLFQYEYLTVVGMEKRP